MSGPDDVRVLTHDEAVEMAGAFVLGALEPADAAAMRGHLVTCPQSHDEIAELGSVLPVLAASAAAVEPPAGLKARLMAAAAAEATATATAPAAPTAAPTPSSVAPAAPTASGVAPAPAAAAAAAAAPPGVTPFPSAAERDERAARRTGRAGAGSWVLRIAAVVAIVALGGSTLLLRNQLSAAQDYQQAVSSVITAAGQPGSLTVVLTADGGTGSGLAAVSASGDVTIAMQDLAPTSGSTVYTAWIIVGDAPSAIGSFQVGNGGTGTFTASGLPTSPGLVLALTREPAAGATTPTLPIISKGVATAAG